VGNFKVNNEVKKNMMVNERNREEEEILTIMD